MNGCIFKQPISYQDLTTAVAHGDAPHLIAILPFANSTDDEGIEDFVRQSFYSHFSVRPYWDIELQVVDRQLRKHDKIDFRRFPKKAVIKIGRILNCDAVIFGEVTRSERIFAGIYSQIAVGANIEMWDTRNNQRIWSDHYLARYHEGGVPLQLLDIPILSVRSGLNLRETQKVRAVDNLCREADAAGVAPERLVFADMLPKPNHLRRAGLADLGLDTRIYNGHTTTSVQTRYARYFPTSTAPRLMGRVNK